MADFKSSTEKMDTPRSHVDLDNKNTKS